jgi:hypothetical protein
VIKNLTGQLSGLVFTTNEHRKHIFCPANGFLTCVASMALALGGVGAQCAGLGGRIGHFLAIWALIG